jgi:signal transduction histidine kinase
MTSIRAYTEALLDHEKLDRDRLRRFLQIIHEESMRLTRLLDSTLDLNVLERGETPWHVSRIDPAAVLDKAVRICQGIPGAERVRLLREDEASGAIVEANSDRLAQVFINVISNAIKYNRSEDPYVLITSRLRDGCYEVLIEDNGPGIEPDEREKIFSKFMRGVAQAQGGVSGAGLGLAISAQIMRRFGGSLTLLNNGERGACFCVSIRRCTAAPAPLL